jgi:parallel beta-helix repeat protein
MSTNANRAYPHWVLHLVVLVMMCVAAAAWAGRADAAGSTFYVDRTVAGCSDTGAGTASTPFCTLAKGVAGLHAGDSLMIGDGTYAETIKPAVSGTADSPVTITRWPGHAPTITGATYGVQIASRAYVVVSDLTFTGTILDGIYVSSSNHITVTGNVVTSAGQPRQGATAPGISLRSSTASTVAQNTSDHNSSHGIYVSGTSTGNTIEGNEASWNAEGWRRNANGIDVIAPGNSILRNVLHDNEDTGLNFYTGGNDNLATLNVSYNNGDHGIDDYDVTGGRLIGNTIYHNCTSGINVEGTSGHYQVVNNISVDNAVYPAYNGISCSRRAGNIGIWDSAPSTTVVDHNLVWLSKTGTMYVFGSPYKSLQAMQAATAQEAAGVQADPKFADAPAGHFQLTSGSLAIDRGDSGVSGAQDHDIVNAERVRDPSADNSFAAGPRLYDDLGAYEFQPDAGSGPAAPSARLSVTPTSGAAPLQVSADASASSDPQGQTLSYAFDFGDGTTTDAQASGTAAHTYSSAGSYVLKVTVTDTSGLSSSDSSTVTVTAPPPPPTNPSFVGSVANNYSTSPHTSGSITVWRTGGVSAGDLVVLTLQLSGTSSSGTVSGTDAAGNAYVQMASVSDGSGNRLVLLSGVVTKSLVVNDRITVSFPTAATYRLGGDEFAGVTVPDQVATATGTGSSFSSGPAPATSGNDIGFGAVAVPSGTSAPSWATGWRNIGTYSQGAQYLGRAYQLPVSGSATATGTAGGAWLAAVVTLKQ